MRGLIIVLIVVFGVATFESWRYAFDMSTHGYPAAGNLGAVAGLISAVLAIGLIGLLFISTMRFGEWLPLRVVRIWINRVRSWADANERKP